jgi:hypothetical protein
MTGYKGWGDSDTERFDNAATAGRGEGEFWTPKSGEGGKAGMSVLRVLPAPVVDDGDGERNPIVVANVHRVEFTGRTVRVNCPRIMLAQGDEQGPPCPVCERVNQLRRTGSQSDRDLSFEIAAKFAAFLVVDVISEPGGKKHDPNARIWRVGKTVYEQLKSLRNDPDVGDFLRPDATGFNLKVERKGTGVKDTEYTVRPAAAQSPVRDLELIERAPDLRPYALVKSYEAIVGELREAQNGKSNGSGGGGDKALGAGGKASGGGAWRGGEPQQEQKSQPAFGF